MRFFRPLWLTVLPPSLLVAFAFMPSLALRQYFYALLALPLWAVIKGPFPTIGASRRRGVASVVFDLDRGLRQDGLMGGRGMWPTMSNSGAVEIWQVKHRGRDPGLFPSPRRTS